MKKGITIISAKYVEGYKIEITFSDGKVNIFDYQNLVMREHEETIPYHKIENFKKFSIVEGKTEIAWGKNWDMILPLATIYNKTTVKEKKSPYNPEFVKMINKAEKSKNRTEVKDVNDLWGSLGLKKKPTIKTK